MRPTVLLADSQALVLEAFACLLEPAFEVVGRATDGMRLVEEALRLEPALVLTDVSLPRLGGLTAVAVLEGVEQALRGAVVVADTEEVAGPLGGAALREGTAWTNNGSIRNNSGTLTLNAANGAGSINNAGPLLLNAGTMNLGGTGILSDVLLSGGFSRTAGTTLNLTGTLDLQNSATPLDIGTNGQFGTGGLGMLFSTGRIKNGAIDAGADNKTLVSSNGTLDNVTIDSNLNESGTLYILNDLTLANGVDFNTGSSNVFFKSAAATSRTGAGGYISLAYQNRRTPGKPFPPLDEVLVHDPDLPRQRDHSSREHTSKSRRRSAAAPKRPNLLRSRRKLGGRPHGGERHHGPSFVMA